MTPRQEQSFKMLMVSKKKENEHTVVKYTIEPYLAQVSKTLSTATAFM